MQDMAQTVKRNIFIVNLVPAAEHSDYKCDIGKDRDIQISKTWSNSMMLWRKWNLVPMEDFSSASSISSKTKSGLSTNWMKPLDKMIMSFLTALDRFNSLATNLYSEKLSDFYKNMVKKI